MSARKRWGGRWRGDHAGVSPDASAHRHALRFRGELGLDESELRRLLVDRHGARPALGRAPAAVETLQAHYKEAGYLNARVSSAIEPITPESVALVMNITSGARARIGRIDIRGQIDPAKPAESTPERIQARLGIAPGRPFDGRTSSAASRASSRNCAIADTTKRR